MEFLRSIKSFFRRAGRKLIRKLGRKKLIIITAATVIGGAALAAAIVFVLKSNSANDNVPADSGLDITISNDETVTTEDPDTEPVIETASADTKVESTEETTILVEKENALKGYLNRCVFLGDSRTVAMVNYGFINDDAALAQIGISHPSFKNNTFINNAGKEYTLRSYLASHQAPVIYIALGVNGINDPSEEHYESTFIDLIDTVTELAPNSNIVLMSIGPVDDNGPYRNTVQNAWIDKYNEFLLNTAREKHIFFLDEAQMLKGDNGQVRSEYNGGDGLHYSGSGCEAILDYIVSHPVPGIPDDGEYVVKYVKPNPRNTKVTMDDGSGIDEAKLKEIMNMMVDATPTPTATPTPDYEQQRLEEERRAEEERRQREEEEEEERRQREAEEEERRQKEAEEEARKQKEAEEEAAQKKAEEEAAQKKAEEEAAQKKAEEEAAQKKAEEEAAQKKAEEEAAQKKTEEETSQDKTEEKPAEEEKPPEENNPSNEEKPPEENNSSGEETSPN